MAGPSSEFDTVFELCQREYRRLVLTALVDQHQNNERPRVNPIAEFDVEVPYFPAIPDADSTLATPRES